MFWNIKVKNVLPIKPCLAQKNVGVSHGECWQQILYLVLISKWLSNNSLFWHTDKFTVSKIVESGRSKPKLQIKVVKKNFSCLYMKNINHKIPRISPESNMEIDRVSFENSTFKPIIEKWNTMTIVYFLYYKKTLQF